MSRKSIMYWPSIAMVTCFILLIFTGVLLGLWYEPSPEYAYESIVFISQYVYFGQVMLSLHHWATHLLIISILLHMLRIFVMGTYKRHPQAWMMGTMFLIASVLFVFSGYLLRYDEVGYWSIKITTSLVSYTPFVGSFLQELILGGSSITSLTVSKFYMVHVCLLTVITLTFLGMHYYSVKKIRVSLFEVGVGMVIAGFLMLFSILYPFQLGPRPSPELLTSLKPVWFFLWLYVIERVLTPSLNFLNSLVLIAVVLLISLLPHIDRGEETEKSERKRIAIGILFVLIFLLLTALGYLW